MNIIHNISENIKDYCFDFSYKNAVLRKAPALISSIVLPVLYLYVLEPDIGYATPSLTFLMRYPLFLMWLLFAAVACYTFTTDWSLDASGEDDYLILCGKACSLVIAGMYYGRGMIVEAAVLSGELTLVMFAAGILIKIVEIMKNIGGKTGKISSKRNNGKQRGED